MNARGAVAVVLALTTAAVGLSAAPAAVAVPGPTLVVAPEDGGIIRSGRDLAVDVTVANPGTTTLPARRLAFALDEAPVASTSTMLSLLAQPTTQMLGYLTSTTAKVPAIGAGQSATVRATISATDSTMRGLLRAGSGARLLYVQYGTDAGGAHLVQKSVVAYMATSSTRSVGFGTVIPVIAPANSTGLVDTDEQETLTQRGGAWDAALHAAEQAPGATVALDPAVIASIRLAGTAAPPGAVDFLNTLQGLPNEFVKLPYADGDVTLQRAAGVDPGTTLPPTSFSGSSVVSAPSPGDTATPQPTPTLPAKLDTVAALTDWGWSDQKVAWPVPGTASATDIAGLGRNGEAVLLASTDVADTAARRAAGPLARIGRTRVLVADATLSGLLATATERSTRGDAALAELTAFLATTAVSGETTALLAVAGRSADLEGLGRVLRLLERQPWIDGRSLAQLATQRQEEKVGPGRTRIPASRVAIAKALMAGESDVRVLGQAITQDAAHVTGPQRLALLGLLSTAWRGNDRGWATAASATEKTFADLAGSVLLSNGSDSGTTAIGTDGRLTVTVLNRLAYPVKVVVRAAVSNGRLQFSGDSRVTVAVPADASSGGKLYFRSIANGSSDVTLTLATPSGTVFGRSALRPVTVRAGFDTVVAVVLLSALGLLLALGVYRNVRRRRPRAVAA